MKILVTGCAGFIGSHLCERLIERGDEVTGVDCLSDYYDPQLKLHNLKGLVAEPNFDFVQLDLSQSSATAANRQLVEDADVIFHMAAQPGVRASWGASFDTYLRNNVQVTQQLLELARGSKRLGKFVYASSSSVYGQTTAEQVSEENPTHPFSPYGVTKLAAEHLCSLYEANYGLPTISLRFFTVYGPRQRPDMAFNRLIHAALTGGAFSVYGDGNQERDFTFVGDIVDGLQLAAFTRGATGVYNIGGGHVISLNEVIRIVERITGRKVQLQRFEAQKGDVRRTSADISKIRSLLGYRPKVQIEEGLRAEVEYFAEQVAM